MPIGESDSAIVMKSASSSFFSGGGGGGLVGEECAAAGEVGRYAPGMSLSCGKLSAVVDRSVNAIEEVLFAQWLLLGARGDGAWSGWKRTGKPHVGWTDG